MIEVFINGERLELNSDTKIAYSLQINNLFELRNRQANFTNKFSLPKTKENLRIIGHTENVNSDSLIPYQKLETKLIDNGIELMSGGNSYIDNIEDNVELASFDGNDEWFEMIKDLKLTDIDLSALDHNYTLTNIFNSRINTWEDGYIYPIIRFFWENLNTDSTIRQVYTNEMFPFAFIKYLFEKIIAPTGYFFSGDFYESTVFKNLIMSTINLKGNETTNLQLEMAKAYVNNNITISPIPFLIIPFLNVIENFAEQIKYNPSVPMSYYQINSDGKYSIFLLVAGYAISLPQTFKIEIRKYTDDITIYETLSYEIGYPIYDKTFNINTKINEIDLKCGDKIYFIITVISGTLDNVITSGTFFHVTNAEAEYTPPNYNLPINLPDLSQVDFIKAIAQKYGLFFQTDNITKEIKISKLSDLYKNKLNAYDWSEKLDLSKPVKIQFEFGDYAQNNKMVYSNDTEPDKLMIKEYAEGSFQINNELLESQKEVITSPFSATRMIKYFNNLDAPFIQITKPNNILNIQDLGITARILILDRQAWLTDEMVWEDFDGITQWTSHGDIPLCYFTLTTKTENLDFQSLINNYYSELAYMFDKAKMVTAYFNLNATDIHNIDLTRPVYIRSFGEYFYINKIQDYLQNNSTKVELIRL